MFLSIKNLTAVVISFTLSASAPQNIIEIAPAEIEQLDFVLTEYDQRQIKCLAENSYHEARGEPRLGQIAVSNVVLNRTEDPRFPSDPCSVIKQRNKRGCQFTWVCQGKKIRNWDVYREQLELAREVYLSDNDITNGAQFYHAAYVSPSWSRVFTRTKRIGLHIFYRS